MNRKQLIDKKQHKDRIRWRGHEVTRIEAFSDAVIAFAVTLLIVALEVPETYDELMHCLMFFFPFAICFTILFSIWYAQNKFFRRFGLHDKTTIILNGMLLFTALFFVYPLKFLFGSLFSHEFKVNYQQMQTLFLVYSFGFMAIYTLFALMYRNALKMKDYLELIPAEVFETETQVTMYLLIASVGVISIIIDFMPAPASAFAGMAYVLIWPISGMYGRKRTKLYEQQFGKNVEAETVLAQVELNTTPDDKLN